MCNKANIDIGDISSIGISSGGQINSQTGTILYATNLGVKNFHLAEKLSEYVKCQINVINDVDAHALGEQKLGAGKNYNNLVYLYVGFGIGSSIIIDKKIYRGSNFLAGEIGHSTVNLNGTLCLCGNFGCLDAISSRRAIGNAIQASWKQGRETILSSMIDLSSNQLDIGASLIGEAIDRKDQLTISIVEDAGIALGAAVANVVNFLNPNAIILGGDLVDTVDLLYLRALDSSKRRSLLASYENVSILKAKLGATAEVYGAAMFSRSNL